LAKEKKQKNKKGSPETENQQPDAAVVPQRFKPKKKKTEFDWLLIPIILVTVLIVGFMAKIAFEMIEFSKQVNDVTGVVDTGTSVVVAAQMRDIV